MDSESSRASFLHLLLRLSVCSIVLSTSSIHSSESVCLEFLMQLLRSHTPLGLRGVACWPTSEIRTTSLQWTWYLPPKCPLFGGFTVTVCIQLFCHCLVQCHACVHRGGSRISMRGVLTVLTRTRIFKPRPFSGKTHPFLCVFLWNFGYTDQQISITSRTRVSESTSLLASS